MSRPCVGVTGPDRGGGGAWWMTRMAIERAGGKPRRITPSRPADVGGLDALVLGGGADIHPELYGEKPAAVTEVVADARASAERKKTPRTTVLLAPALYLFRRAFARHDAGPDRDRDALERDLLKKALERSLPVLGICRGAQMINVVLGGDLYRELHEFYVETPQVRTVLPRKTVEIVAGSRLADLLGSKPCAVNALHHQAVRKLGQGVTVAACERSGVIQAIEARDYPFVIGVQWHPEYLPQHPRQRRIFEALVDAAKAHCAREAA